MDGLLVKQLGVENGERAKYIYSQFVDMNPEEQKEYLANLRIKKLLSNDVLKQLIILKQLQP
jgi:hypothetical protein